MANRHTRSKQKPSGGLYRPYRKHKKYEQGGEFTATTLGDHEVREQDARGNDSKDRVKRTETISLSNDGETEQVEIEAVLENTANPDYVRRDILTKGTIVETNEGKARITSRPGQDGTVNAVLVDE